MNLGLILSSQGELAQLRRCLLALSAQTDRDFRIQIACYQSATALKKLLHETALKQLQIEVVWCVNPLSRLTMMNRAIAESTADYVILTTEQALPRNDLIARHRAAAKLGQYVSGGVVPLTWNLHSQLHDADILNQRVFEPAWLAAQDADYAKYRRRLTRQSPWQSWWNLWSWRYAFLRTVNCGLWRDDLLTINGFDETIDDPSEADDDLAIRLTNAGCRSKYLKYTIVTLEQEFAPIARSPQSYRNQRRRYRQRVMQRTTWIEDGIQQERHAA
jgi:hypothetical protein